MFKSLALLSTSLLAIQAAPATTTVTPTTVPADTTVPSNNTELTWMQAAKDANVTMFINFAKLTGLDEELDKENANVTIMAPSNDAMKAAGWDINDEFYKAEDVKNTHRVKYLRKLLEFHVGMGVYPVDSLQAETKLKDAMEIKSIYSTEQQGHKKFSLFLNKTNGMPYVLDNSGPQKSLKIVANITTQDIMITAGSLNVIDGMLFTQFLKDDIESNNWLWLVVLGIVAVFIGAWLMTTVASSAHNAKKALEEENLADSP